MVDYAHAGQILSEMVQIGRTFRTAGQRNGQGSLTGTRYGFLQHLSHCDARLSDLAHRLLISAPVASRAIDSLEADGMVERRTDPEDARASLISITALGRAKLTESEGRAVQRFADALTDWSPQDAAQAIDILQTLNAHLSDVIDAPDTTTNTTPNNHESENHG